MSSIIEESLLDSSIIDNMNSYVTHILTHIVVKIQQLLSNLFSHKSNKVSGRATSETESRVKKNSFIIAIFR